MAAPKNNALLADPENIVLIRGWGYAAAAGSRENRLSEVFYARSAPGSPVYALVSMSLQEAADAALAMAPELTLMDVQDDRGHPMKINPAFVKSVQPIDDRHPAETLMLSEDIYWPPSPQLDSSQHYLHVLKQPQSFMERAKTAKTGPSQP